MDARFDLIFAVSKSTKYQFSHETTLISCELTKVMLPHEHIKAAVPLVHTI